jgi:hypothetical protein
VLPHLLLCNHEGQVLHKDVGSTSSDSRAAGRRTSQTCLAGCCLIKRDSNNPISLWCRLSVKLLTLKNERNLPARLLSKQPQQSQSQYRQCPLASLGCDQWASIGFKMNEYLHRTRWQCQTGKAFHRGHEE